MQKIDIRIPFLEFPPTYTYHGGNFSPPLFIRNPTAESYAIMVFNPFIKSCCSFTPWIIWNIPSVEIIPEGIPLGPVCDYPISAVQGINDYGEIGYHGPEPHSGDIHRYQFRVYGLDIMLSLPGGATKDDLISAMKDHVIAYGETVALCTG